MCINSPAHGLLALLLLSLTAHADWRGGAARVNITPSYPVRLSGYGNRTTTNEGVKVDIWAKALAIAWNDEPPAVVLTVDNVGVPGSLRAEVLAALKEQHVEDARFAVCSTHTHCAPMLNGVLGNLFGADLSADDQAKVDRYTNDLRDWLIKAARNAIAAMKPAKLEMGHGEVKFAGNRRYPSPTGFANSPNPEGPTDHDLPVLKVSNMSGEVIGVFTSYACHCTTMGWNFIHPDWAGIAQLHMEMAFPKAVALTAIGCGADQNPYPRREENLVRIHGYNLGREAIRVCNSPMHTLAGPLNCGQRKIKLPFDTLPTEAELRAKAANSKAAAEKRHAGIFLTMLERKQSIPTELPYLVEAWNFGDGLSMVFLNGEVVVDYSLRLKREYDKERLWVNGYSNDVPCYIPSDRVLKEGGYEGGGAMIYYLRPTKFAPGLEDRIVSAVEELVPATFKAK
jgi:hypothetical protein